MGAKTTVRKHNSQIIAEIICLTGAAQARPAHSQNMTCVLACTWDDDLGERLRGKVKCATVLRLLCIHVASAGTHPLLTVWPTFTPSSKLQH